MSSVSSRRTGVAGIIALAFLTLVAGLWIQRGRPAGPEERGARGRSGMEREASERDGGGPGARPSEWFVAQRAWPGTEIPHAAYREALEEARMLRAESAIRVAGGPGSWQPAGPENIGGRVTALAIHPSAPGTIYAGAADGGVLKSTDGGATWTPLTDFMGSLSVGALAADPADPSVVWLGTGEANASGDSYDGIGIFRSADGGVNWVSKGLPASYHINRIVVDPTDSNIVWAAVSGKLFGKNPERGVYRTTDGGSTWNRVLFLSDSTACIDIVIDPVRPDTAYAAMWERIRRPYDRRVGGLTSGVWRTQNGGATWTRLAGGLPAASTTQGRIGLAISASNPLRLYAIYANHPGDFAGVYKTSDGGNTWTRTSDGTLASMYGGYGWYFGNIRVDPTNPDRVFAMGLDIYRSTNGGSTWSRISGSMHVDQHDMWISPSTPNTMIAANDGGIYRTTTGSNPWTKFMHLPITQFYAGTVDYLNPQRLYGGTQDNGTPRTTTGALDDWADIYGGDGFYCIVDPTDSDVIYAESQYGYFGKSTDGGASFSEALNGVDLNDRFNWSTPVVMDPSSHLTLYLGTQRLWKTTDGAANWTAVSGDLTGGPGPGSLVYGTITTIAVAPSNGSVIYAGTDDSNVWVTQNGGGSWTSIRAGLPTRWVTRVAVDPGNAGTCYVTLSGYKHDSYLPHVFRSTDFGATWSDISSNLPQGPANVIVVDPAATNRLYLGTDFGVFASNDTGASWFALGDNLPLSSVNDLVLHPPTRTLVAMTHGRSMFRYDLGQLTGVAGGVPGTGGPGAGARLDVAAAPNPFAERTRLSFRLASAGAVRLVIYDVRGREVRELASRQFPAGPHELTWDGRTNRGDLAASGTYYARLVAGGKSGMRELGFVR